MKDISEKRLSDYMAEQIADEILSGRIPGGSQLKQEELAEAFEASRIPIREAFQILENQGLIIRLATRRITVTELDEEQICLIYSMISEMTKKALDSLKHSKKTEELYERLTTPGLLGEVQPAEVMCDLVENEYIKRLLRNASDSYIRFALSTGRHKEEIKEENLQEALERTLEKYPLFRAVLRKGLFWFYLERRDIRAVVKPEKKPPCSQLYIPDQKSLLFRVSYHRNRINFAMSLTLSKSRNRKHL